MSGDYFGMLGVGAELGRTFVPDDAAAPGHAPVMVLSNAGWRKLFAGDRDIVGKKVLVRGYPLEVVGIAGNGFEGLNEVAVDFWIPLTMNGQVTGSTDIFGSQQPETLSLMGRLRPGVGVTQASAILTSWAQRMSADRPQQDRATGATLYSRATSVRLGPQAFLVLFPVLAAFALILLIACANVANMMLARAMARQREIGIRLSLGAARGRLIRQLLTESVMLALPAAFAGFLISRAAIAAALRAMLATLPREFVDFITIVPLDPDVRVFAFMMAAAIVAALLFGLAPAIQATRNNVVQASRGDFGNEFRPQRLRNTLLVVQITVCAMPLICAGVLLRGANGIHNRDIGLRTADVIWIEVPEKSRVPVISRLAAEPLVQTIAASLTVRSIPGFPPRLFPRVTTI